MTTDKGGQPTKMTKETLKVLEEMFCLGLKDEDACFRAGISPQTLYNYQKVVAGYADRKARLKKTLAYKARKTVSLAVETDSSLAMSILKSQEREEFGTAPLVAINADNVESVVDSDDVARRIAFALSKIVKIPEK